MPAAALLSLKVVKLPYWQVEVQEEQTWLAGAAVLETAIHWEQQGWCWGPQFSWICLDFLSKCKIAALLNTQSEG